MALVMLTETNVRHLADVTRALLPSAKADHVSDAITIALQARSSAHLVAAARWHGGFPEIAFCDDDAFRRVMTEWGEVIRASFSLGAIAQEVLPHPLFIECRRSEREAQSDHYHHCSQWGWPLITIFRGSKYSEVQWDYITMAGDDFPFFDGEAGEQFIEEVANSYVLFAAGNSPQSLFHGNCYSGSITKLLPETARDLADFLFDVMYTPMRAMHLEALRADA